MKQLPILTSLFVMALPWCGQALDRLPYNHPGLAVDLGVGLWAWPVPCDADGDGDFDLIVSCPDKPSNGVYLFENVTGDTARTKMPVFKPGRLLSKTVTYVMPSYVDGGMRVLTPAVEYKNFTKTGLDEKVELSVSAKFHKPEGTQPKGPKMRHNQWRYADYDGDGALDLVVAVEDWSYYGWDDAWNAEGKWQNGPLHGWVYVLRNTGSTKEPVYDKPFFVEAAGVRLDVFGCPSPNFEDFDGDGDLDLLCGEFLDKFTYFENVGTRKEPRYTKGRRLKNGKVEDLMMDLEMIVPVAFDWDKDGDFDLIVGDEDGRVAFIENTGKLSTDRTPLFKDPVYFQQEADTLKCGALATPVGFDWDGDGDTDIVSGNTAGYIEFFENLSGPKVAKPKWAAPVRLSAGGKVFRVLAGPNGSIQGPAEAKWGYTTLNIQDWDADGLPDIVVNAIWGRVQWLKNVGTRTKPELAAPQPMEVEWQGETPKPAWVWWKPTGKELVTQWRTTPVIYDFNQDGLMDLAMLDQEGYLAYFERAKQGGKLVLKSPQRAFVDEKGDPLQLNSGTAGRSGRRKLCLTDWDGDGKFDLLLNSSNADFLQQVEANDGKWIMRNAGTLAEKNIEGHDVSPTVVDFDGNGVPDFLGGAEDGRFYYLQNPRSRKGLTASPIMRSEFIFEENAKPAPSCHASTIVEAKDGSLVSSWFGGTAEGKPDVVIWVSRAVDGKWSSPVEVANGVQPDGTRHPCWNPVLFQPREGPLMLFYKAGPTPQNWWGMLRTSKDNGKTWSEPTRLPGGILGPIKNKPVQLADGTILCPTSSETVSKPSVWRVHFEMTKDVGKTWTTSRPVSPGEPPLNAIQPSVLFLGKEKLLALGRTREGKVFQVTSGDSGKTWGDMSLTSLPNPNSGTDALTMKDGRHVLIYNHTPKGRSPINVAISEDGLNWKGALVLESGKGEYSYPAVIQTRDGLLHFTYTWKRELVKHVVVDPKQLQPREIRGGVWPE